MQPEKEHALKVNTQNVSAREASKPINDDLIRKVRRSGFKGLRFPRHLEKLFRQKFSDRYLLYRRVILLLGTGVLLLMAIVDFRIVYPNWGPFHILRYAISSPIMAIFLLMSWTPWFKKRQNSSLSIVFCLIVITSFAWMVTGPEITVYLYSTGILLLILYSGIMLRLRFPYAVFCIFFTIIGQFIVIIFIKPQSIDFISAQLVYCLGAGFMAVVTAYYTEYIFRHNFLTLLLLKSEQKKLKQANRSLQHLASKDGLTRIANRRYFDNLFSKECSKARREQQPISLLMIDIDHFKDFNDTYGHAAGDECLIDVANLLTEFTRRPNDLAARYGGEEFVVLLPNTEQEFAYHIAENIIKDLLALKIVHASSSVAPFVTVSIGLVTRIPTKSAEQEVVDILKKSDDALYQAKHSGKNQVLIYQEQ